MRERRRGLFLGAIVLHVPAIVGPTGPLGVVGIDEPLLTRLGLMKTSSEHTAEIVDAFEWFGGHLANGASIVAHGIQHQLAGATASPPGSEVPGEPPPTIEGGPVSVDPAEGPTEANGEEAFPTLRSRFAGGAKPARQFPELEAAFHRVRQLDDDTVATFKEAITAEVWKADSPASEKALETRIRAMLATPGFVEGNRFKQYDRYREVMDHLARVLAEKVARTGPSARELLTVPEGTTVYRGVHLLGDVEIPDLFERIYPGLVPSQSRGQLGTLDATKAEAESLLDDPAKRYDLGRQIYWHSSQSLGGASGPWVSTSLSLGIAAKFARDAAGRGLLVVVKAPASSIDLALAHRHLGTPNSFGSEQEVLIPGAVDPQDIQEVLELRFTSGTEAVVVKRWSRDANGLPQAEIVDPPESVPVGAG
jgi:hypothetical protein